MNNNNNNKSKPLKPSKPSYLSKRKIKTSADIIDSFYNNQTTFVPDLKATFKRL